jgi:hypothetical protein
VGATRDCTLLDKPSAVLPIHGSGAIMANAGGTGYYRFSLAEPEWHKLIADSAELVPGEALALTDSLWAAFRAGEVPASLLLEAARAMVDNGYSAAVSDGGQRLAGLRQRGMIAGDALPGYRAFIRSIYAPKLRAMGFDPAAGAYAGEDADRQKLRSDLVSLVAGEAEDSELRARLAAAATAWLGGDRKALDQSFLTEGLSAYLATGGAPAVETLFDKAFSSDDTLFRDSALVALAGTGQAASGRWLLDHIEDERLRLSEKTSLLLYLALEPATRDMAYDWTVAHYDELVKGSGIFSATRLPSLPGRYCSVEKAAAVEAALRPKVDKYKRGQLALDRTVEQIHSCGVLEEQRGAEIAAAFS